MNIVLPMAGRGSRLKDQGYATPKPLIEINLIGFEEWKDLISNKIINDIDAEIVLKPYQTLWISNQF